MVSRRLAAGRERRRRRRRPSSHARQALYRGQCNCPLLARGVRRHLSAAPAQCDLQPADRRRQPARPGDRQDRRRASKRPPATTTSTPARKCGWPATSSSRLLAPAAAACSTSSTSARSATTCWPRSPAGPKRITARCSPAPSDGNGNVASIHDRVVFKQAGPRPAAAVRPLRRARACSTTSSTPARRSHAVAAAKPTSRATSSRASTKRRSAAAPTGFRCSSPRLGRVGGREIKITKGVTLDAGSPTLEIAYLLENLPAD